MTVWVLLLGCRELPLVVVPTPPPTVVPEDTGHTGAPPVSPPTPPEPFDAEAWVRSAGDATLAEEDPPFDTLRHDLPLEDLGPASLGRELFRATWTVGDGSSVLDGLGPLFNARSCLACHPATGRPASWRADGGVEPGVLLRALSLDGEPDPTYGNQLQPGAIDGVQAEIEATWVGSPSVWTLSDGTEVPLQRPDPSLALGYGPLAGPSLVAPRLSPQLAGMGLLQAVSQSDLESLADPDDLDGDGISGRLPLLGPDTLGRFGWKAGSPTVRTQSAAAFHADMGLTSPLHPDAACTPTQTACNDLAGSEEEVSDAELDQVASYLMALGVPPRRLPVHGDPRAGAALFVQVGCADCHLPTLHTAPDAEPAHLAGQELHPYTDLLLHDLGPALADASEGTATASEWRTPPLWGLSRVLEADGRLLHDGRARNVLEAIGWHGGEASSSRQAVADLPPADRALLLEHLGLL